MLEVAVRFSERRPRYGVLNVATCCFSLYIAFVLGRNTFPFRNRSSRFHVITLSGTSPSLPKAVVHRNATATMDEVIVIRATRSHLILAR